MPSALDDHQNIIRTGDFPGAGRDDRFRSNVDFTTLFHGLPHVRFAHELYRFWRRWRWRRGGPWRGAFGQSAISTRALCPTASGEETIDHFGGDTGDGRFLRGGAAT